MSEEPRVEPLSAEELDAQRAFHAPCFHYTAECLESRWLATIDAERERADRAEAEVARLRAALESLRVLHVDEWSDACPVAVRQAGDRCEDCYSEGLSECTCKCTCSADTHNAAIDAALNGGQE